MQSESATTRRLMVSVSTVYLLLSCIAQYERGKSSLTSEWPK